MVASVHPESKSRSRRALLAGALGGIGAWAASAIGRHDSVRAGVDGDVVLGVDNAAVTTTKITNATNSNTVFWAASGSGNGIYGSSTSNSGVVGGSSSWVGVWGVSTSEAGVHGFSTTSVGVWGTTSAVDKPATAGQSNGNGSGVLGYSGTGDLPPATPKTGVYGYAAQDSASRGVVGDSPAGHGVHGHSSTGWAGYFDGRILTKKYHELVEINTPSAPPSNHARLFIRDNLNGKTQLCVRFATGAVKVLATQP
jgi:hypothetical protein